MSLWIKRNITCGDADIIACHRYFGEQVCQIDKDAYVTWLRKAIHDGRYFGLLAERHGNIIAGAGMTLLDWGPTRGDPNPYRARIVNVFTVSDMRRQGIASSLVADLLKLGVRQGIQTYCLAASEDAKHMYRCLGFLPYDNEMLLKLS